MSDSSATASTSDISKRRKSDNSNNNNRSNKNNNNDDDGNNDYDRFFEDSFDADLLFDPASLPDELIPTNFESNFTTSIINGLLSELSISICFDFDSSRCNFIQITLLLCCTIDVAGHVGHQQYVHRHVNLCVRSEYFQCALSFVCSFIKF